MEKMFESFKVDLKMLLIIKISISELMCLLKVYSETVHKQLFNYKCQQEDLDSLVKKMMLKKKDNEYVLRGNGKIVVEKTIGIEIKETSEEKQPSYLEIDDLVSQIRERFKGLKPGSMGDEKALKQKLIRWRMENPDVSSEDIMEAVDIYLSSQDNLKYVQRADYFIYKRQGGSESSRLSIYVDEMKDRDEGDWTSNLT